jgi:hypothetical protein
MNPMTITAKNDETGLFYCGGILRRPGLPEDVPDWENDKELGLDDALCQMLEALPQGRWIQLARNDSFMEVMAFYDADARQHVCAWRVQCELPARPESPMESA